MDEEKLNSILAELTALNEAGRVLSAKHRDKVASMREMAAGLAYHPIGKQILDLCEELLAASDKVQESTDGDYGDAAYLELLERTFTTDQRKAMADKGMAMADGCLAGETLVATQHGPRRIDSLIGECELLTDVGWTYAEVRSFGVQQLLAVVLSNGRDREVVHATAGHRWKLPSGEWKLTNALAPGDRIPHVEVLTEGMEAGAFNSANRRVAGHAKESSDSTGRVVMVDLKGRPCATSPGVGSSVIRNSPADCAASALPDHEGLEVDLRDPVLTHQDAVAFSHPALISEFDPLGTLPAALLKAESAVGATALVPDVEVGVRTLSAARSADDRPFITDRLPDRGLTRSHSSEFFPPASLVVGFTEPHGEDGFFTIGHAASFHDADYSRLRTWRVIEVTSTPRVEEVFCAVVPDLYRFVLASGVLTGNSFPIATKADLANAIKAMGRAKDPAAAKAHILRRAKAMGMTDMLPDDWKAGLKEVVAMSWEETERRVCQALCAAYSQPTLSGEGGMQSMPLAHPVATYEDRVVFSMEGKLYESSYTVADDGAVTLGEPVEVVATFAKVQESRTFIEAADKEGREWDVILIQAGLSLNGNYYPADMLKTAAPLFEGKAAYADHATESERSARPERSIKDKVGVFRNVTFGTYTVAGRQIEGLRARFRVIAPWLRETLLEAANAGEPEFLGFSIDAEGRCTKKPHGGRMVNWVEQLTKVHSVDVVTDPAAGGQVLRLVASVGNGGPLMDPEEIKRLIAETLKEQMAVGLADAIKEQTAAAVGTAVLEAVKPATDGTSALAEQVQALQEQNRLLLSRERIDAALADVSLSDLGKQKVRAALVEAAKRRDLEDEEIATAVQEAVAYEAAVAQQFVKAAGVAPRVRVGDSEHDQFDKGIQGWFNSGVPIDGVTPFGSLKEAYCRFGGIQSWDFDALQMLDDFGANYRSYRDHKRVRESLTTASWGDFFADNLYIMALKAYQSDPYQRWKLFVSEYDNCPDFQTRHWARVGGYGDLPAVTEQGTYLGTTSPADEEVNFAITKRGFLDDVTFEMITGDRFRKLQQLPTAMGRAAARTLFKFVMNMITTDNAAMDYDSVALYAAGHNNTGTTALSLAGLDAVVVAMRDQTAYGETSEILGERNYPKYIIVPNELEQRAIRIVNPSDSYAYGVATPADTETVIDPQAFKGKGIEVVVYDQLTDATDWFVVADPQKVSTLVMGFLGGRQEPEIFVQDQPNVGSAFTADKITYKIRHMYSGSITDHRPYYRQVVAG